MSSTTPIFEESTSPLYYSNDGRLRLVEGRIGTPKRIYVLHHDGVEVLRTQERSLADAYIAGYDLANPLSQAELDLVYDALDEAGEHLGEKVEAYDDYTPEEVAAIEARADRYGAIRIKLERRTDAHDFIDHKGNHVRIGDRVTTAGRHGAGQPLVTGKLVRIDGSTAEIEVSPGVVRRRSLRHVRAA